MLTRAELLGSGVLGMAYRSLPFDANPEVEALRKEARMPLHALELNDFAYRPFDALEQTSRADVQYLVARRYGFRSWASLMDRLVCGPDG